jgi:NAD(P)-dependent dehydrogenase (short-subunit alcohol dehydrogenase family)
MHRRAERIFTGGGHMDLKRRAALVTGGSRGLGAALGRRLAAEGARVVLVAREIAPLEGVVQQIRREGGEAHAVAGDIGAKEDIHRVAGAAAALVGPIDVLVHNASILGPVPLRLLLDTACEDLERTLAVNLVGPFRLTKVIAGSMALRGEGVVVHVSSDAAVSAYARWGAYGISKAALDQLNRTWGAELDEMGVRFVSVDPGEMNTRMHADAMPEADPRTLADPYDVAKIVTRIIQRAETLPNGARVEAAAWAAQEKEATS